MKKTNNKKMKTINHDDFFADKFAKDPELFKLCLEKSFDAYNKNGDLFFLRETLKQAAIAKGMTQLAKETGLSRQYLYKMVSNKGNPTITTLQTVLEVFGFKINITVA